MKRLLLFILTTGTLLSAVLPLYQESRAQTSASCEQALSIIKNDIENRIGGKVESTNQIVASNPSSPFPSRRNQLSIYLSNVQGVVRGRNPATVTQSSKNRAITNSRSLMLDYSDQVISACSQVAKVEFIQGFHPEGVFVLSTSGKIVEPKCAHGTQTPLKWGEDLCM